MRIAPIKNINTSFHSKLLPSKELTEYKNFLKNLGKDHLIAFNQTYDQFEKDGKEKSYKLSYETEECFIDEYKRPGYAMNAVIRDEKNKVVASRLMDVQIHKKYLEPNSWVVRNMFEKDFMKVPHVDSLFDSPVFGFSTNTIRIIRPFSTEDFIKEPFIPDL